MSDNIPDHLVVPISAIEHHEYCPRQAALIHQDGIWTDNPHTVRGSRAHRRTDDPAASRTERGTRVLRAVPLWSEAHGLSGRADVIELQPDGTVLPVEHKAGTRHGSTADLQVCAQAICLEEMLDTAIPQASIWYGATRRRSTVNLTEGLRRRTLDTVRAIRAQLSSRQLPPAPADARCGQCQLRHHCLPEITASAGAIAAHIAELLTP